MFPWKKHLLTWVVLILATCSMFGASHASLNKDVKNETNELASTEKQKVFNTSHDIDFDNISSRTLGNLLRLRRLEYENSREARAAATFAAEQISKTLSIHRKLALYKILEVKTTDGLLRKHFQSPVLRFMQKGTTGALGRNYKMKIALAKTTCMKGLSGNCEVLKETANDSDPEYVECNVEVDRPVGLFNKAYKLQREDCHARHVEKIKKLLKRKPIATLETLTTEIEDYAAYNNFGNINTHTIVSIQNQATQKPIGSNIYPIESNDNNRPPFMPNFSFENSNTVAPKTNFRPAVMENSGNDGPPFMPNFPFENINTAAPKTNLHHADLSNYPSDINVYLPSTNANSFNSYPIKSYYDMTKNQEDASVNKVSTVMPPWNRPDMYQKSYQSNDDSIDSLRKVTNVENFGRSTMPKDFQFANEMTKEKAYQILENLLNSKLKQQAINNNGPKPVINNKNINHDVTAAELNNYVTSGVFSNTAVRSQTVNQHPIAHNKQDLSVINNDNKSNNNHVTTGVDIPNNTIVVSPTSIQHPIAPNKSQNMSHITNVTNGDNVNNIHFKNNTYLSP